ncbi:MAG: acylneuraminate cytidylyltransferase family protein [Gammaproteobacteria bacterium]|nr:MAG: acylneuraminate cytidylyltransferase family protein [Gammaproteobacteria bacterium]
MKAHSERVSGKNFRDFLGKPLFRWVLDALLEVDEIGQIVINTDARHLLVEHGLLESDKILIRDRKDEICGNSISMNAVLADDIANVPADVYVMTHTTNPLLSSSVIKKALATYLSAMEEARGDSLFTVNRVQTRFYRSDASPVNHDPGNLIPTQDLEPWFEENSNLYIFSAKSFSRTGARIGERPVLFESSHLEAIDIDTPEDWEIAQAVAHYVCGINGRNA